MKNIHWCAYRDGLSVKQQQKSHESEEHRMWGEKHSNSKKQPQGTARLTGTTERKKAQSFEGKYSEWNNTRAFMHIFLLFN